MTFPPNSRNRAVGVLAIVLMLSTTLVSHAVEAGTVSRRTRGPFKLAPGITLRVVSYPAPWQVRILTIRPQTTAAIEQADSGSTFGMYKAVSRMGASTGAVAAVNGDFGSFSGYPDHWNMVDGQLRTSGLQQNQAFAINGKGTRAWARSAPNTITAVAPGGSFKISHLNAGEAGPNQFAAYTPAGGKEEHPVGDMCAAKLVPTDGYHWYDSSERTLGRDYKVTAQPQPCVFNAMNFGSKAKPGTVILQVRRSCACASTISALSKGDKLTLKWSSWPRIADEIGAQPQLVSNGVNVAPGPDTSSNYFYGRNPRTGVGISKGCTDAVATTTCVVYVITVDGRQAGWSAGMTLPQFAGLFLGLNPPAYDAVNLDGGGATEMWVKQRNPRYCQSATPAGGCLVNRPSGGTERPNITALEVLSGVDKDAPKVLRSG